MTYTVRIPGKTAPIQMEFAKLKNAYADGNIPGKALVTLEHQDFWYSLAELMGDKETKPLLFPCTQCKQMIRSRAIDRGNPVKCPKCNAALTVPNPQNTRLAASASVAKRRRRPMFVAGLITALMGVGLYVYQFLDESMQVRFNKPACLIIALGAAMMAGRRIRLGPPTVDG